MAHLVQGFLIWTVVDGVAQVCGVFDEQVLAHDASII